MLFRSTYQTDTGAAKRRYCTWNSAMFTGFTDIDRQTELNDDDGSLTGYSGGGGIETKRYLLDFEQGVLTLEV